MAVKSIIDVEIDGSGNFAKFQASFDRYQKALKDSPKDWAKVTDGIGRSRKEFDTLVKQQVASLARTKLIADAEKEALRITTTMGDRWREMARNTKTTAANMKDATVSLLKWTSLTGVVSGLLGAGGLFGINRLAGAVAAGRQTSMGLGASFGQIKSFGVNFGRLVDSPSFLGAIADARSDVSKRVGFYGAGVDESRLNGSTVDVGVEVLRGLKKLADNTDPKMYGNLVRDRQLSLVGGSSELLRLLRATSGQEFEQLASGYRNNTGSLGLEPDTQKKWQDFYTQLNRAGSQIENTFVNGLVRLIPELSALSKSFEEVTRAFLKSDLLKKSIDTLAVGFDKIAKYIEGMTAGGGNTGVVLGAVSGALIGARVGGIPGAVAGAVIGAGLADNTKTLSGAATGGVLGEREGHNTWNEMVRGSRSIRNWSGWTAPNHNPGNLRVPGQSTGFQSFESDEVGLRAMARQLRLYQNRDGLNTVRGVINKYAPPSENNTEAYISAVGKRTGFGADQPLDLNDPKTLSQLISAMTKQENAKSNFSAAGVKVIIENNTGGNAITTTNQLQGQN